MAVLQKTKIHPNERLDLTDYENIEQFSCVDWDEFLENFINSGSLIVRGFEIFQDPASTNDNPTASPIYVKIEDSVLLHTSKVGGPALYVGPTGTTSSEVVLTSNATNYIEIDTSFLTQSPAIRAFWDPTANSGVGAEFSQTVDTIQTQQADVTVNNSGFTGGSKIPIAEIEVDSGGTIVALYDRRNRLFRLGVGFPYNDDHEFPWTNGRLEAIHTLTLSGTVGTFIADEGISGVGSGTTAKVVTGGTSSITVTAKDSASFNVGETINGSLSGATATLVTIKEDFNSADKDIKTLKEWLDAMMTEMKRIKFGTIPNKYWFENPELNLGDLFIDLGMTIITGGGTVSWDGGSMSFTDDILLNAISTGVTYTIQTSESPIALADGEIAYISLSSGSGRGVSGTRAINVVTKDNVPSTNDSYWIAFRKGSLLFVRGMQHELESGEESTIYEGLGNDIFTYIGSNGETDSDPNYSSTNTIVQGDDLTTAIGKLDAVTLPIGSIIPHYDYNGALTFDTNTWAYCDGSTKTIAGIGSQTLPDLSGRYLVGFGTDGGGDIDTAAWATAAVGNAGNTISLSHSHTVNSHTHNVDIGSFASGSESSHTHTVSSHSHSMQSHTHNQPLHTHTGGSLYAKVAVNSGGDGIFVQHVSVSSWSSNAADDAGSATGTGSHTSAVDVDGTTGSGGSDTTGGPSSASTSSESPSTTAGSSHSHTVNPPNTASTGTAPGTDSQLSASQDIQPRSIRCRYIIKIA